MYVKFELGEDFSKKNYLGTISPDFSERNPPQAVFSW